MLPNTFQSSTAVLIAVLAPSVAATHSQDLPPTLLVELAGLQGPPGACLLPDDADFATSDGGCMDLATGLVWGASSVRLDPPIFGTEWDNAVDLCEISTEAGYDDWFLPTKEELVAVDANGGATHLNMDQGANYFYWSSTQQGSQRAWVQRFFPSESRKVLKSSRLFFFCARIPGPSGPPAAPTNLGAGAVSASQIDLTWTDNAVDEVGFQLDRSLDGNNWSTLATLPADTTSHSDNGLAASTTYWYRVLAYNSAGNSVYSNTASATTLPSTGGGDAVANGEFTIDGTVTAGSYLSTHSDDNTTEAIREERTNGPPSNRISFLEHKWTFDVQDGTGITVRGNHDSNEEDFEFAWSLTDGNDYISIGTITSSSEQVLDYVFPSTVSGTVYVRVLDTDRTPGNGDSDTVYVDHISIGQ